MTDVVDLATARRISDERDRELREICDEMTQAGHVLADTINALRDAILGGCDGEILVSHARAVADADARLSELSERGWACGHRRLAP